MSLNVMNTNQWDFFRIADCLCCCHTYQKSPHQPWSIGDTDSINVIQAHMCFIQCFLNDLINLFNVLSGCNLRNYTSI